MELQIIRDQVSIDEIRNIAANQFGDMVKFVVDVEKEILAIGGDLHADEEAILIQDGSAQNNLWGINYYPDKASNERIEFDSMINIRPSQNNRSRDVEDPAIREKIVQIINKMVKK